MIRLIVDLSRTFGPDIEAAESTAKYAHRRAEDAERALVVRRARIALGDDARDVVLLRAALANTTLLAAGEEADAADAKLHEAEEALRRCRRSSRPTPLAQERRNAVSDSRRRASIAAAAFDTLLAAARVPSIATHRIRALTDRLRLAEALTDESVLPVELKRAQEESTKADAKLVDAQARRMPEATLGALARLQGPKGRALLARLIAGYKPKDGTIAKEPLYATLIEAGLTGGRASPTHLGYEVAKWASEHLLEPDPERTLAPLGWTQGHTMPERRAMAERVMARIAALDSGDEDTALVEVGDPGAGYSYRLVPTRENMTWFYASLRLKKQPQVEA